MIRLVEALNYRCLRNIQHPLRDFQVLVGPNASGKTSFLDVIGFLGDLLRSDKIQDAVEKRTSTFHDLLFNHQGDRFQLGVELEIPSPIRERYDANKRYQCIRYEISVGMSPEYEIHIFDEKVYLLAESTLVDTQRTLFPMPRRPQTSIMHSGRPTSKRTIISKKYDGNDNFNSETHSQGGKGWAPSIRLGPLRSALKNLPAMEDQFPATIWMRELLSDKVQTLMLNSLALRQSSPPGKGYRFQPDGSNLPWVIHDLKQKHPEKIKEWIGHLQTALPDIEDIEIHEKPDLRHLYLRLIYRGGLSVPSWMVSDGTLRLLALTLPAYLPNLRGVFLIEEPENGIHPMALETAYQSLSSVYDSQILIATHSPVLLGQAKPEDVLCFKKGSEGATDIVSGNEHPKLKDWQGTVNFGDLYASGVLG